MKTRGDQKSIGFFTCCIIRFYLYIQVSLVFNVDSVPEGFLEKILSTVLEERFPEVESVTEHLKNITRKPCLQSRMGKMCSTCCKPDMKRNGVSHCADFSFSVQFFGMSFFLRGLEGFDKFRFLSVETRHLWILRASLFWYWVALCQLTV